MTKDYIQETSKYMQKHKYLTLATVDQNGQPAAATLGFAADKTTTYVATSDKTQKMLNIHTNPKVAYTIDDEETTPWEQLQGLQMMGIAEVVTDPNEINIAGALLLNKFPEFADMPKDKDMVFIKITPTKGRFLDCSVHFGFSSELKF